MTNDELTRAKVLHEQWVNGALRGAELLEMQELFGRLCGVAEVLAKMEASAAMHGRLAGSTIVAKDDGAALSWHAGAAHGAGICREWIRML